MLVRFPFFSFLFSFSCGFFFASFFFSLVLFQRTHPPTHNKFHSFNGNSQKQKKNTTCFAKIISTTKIDLIFLVFLFFLHICLMRPSPVAIRNDLSRFYRNLFSSILMAGLRTRHNFKAIYDLNSDKMCSSDFSSSAHKLLIHLTIRLLIHLTICQDFSRFLTITSTSALVPPLIISFFND